MRRAIIDKRYKIVKKIGTGATGSVYKVQDSKNNKILALKILSKEKTSSEAVQRFKREFKLLTRLHHPNLSSVYDFGTIKDGRNYFTMEYIDGPNILEFTKKLPYKKLYPWIVQLCRVLEYIHSRGLIHYDIKPGNVLIKRSLDNQDKAIVKLMDFGLAGVQRIKGGAIIKGTLPYIAPEVIEGLAVDHRADLYSLGVLLYEIFTRKPFQEERESFVTLLQERRNWSSKSISETVPDIPRWLERLIVRLLSFEPASRFSRANEVIKEINKFSRLKFEAETEKTIEGYLLSSRFVGRNNEMKFLQSLYERACRGDGKVVLVTGDAGIGKSRLLKEFKIYTQLQRSHSFTGNAYKNKTSPLEPFYDVFSELINYVTDRADPSRFQKHKMSLAVLFKIFPDLTDGHLRKNLPKLVPLGPEQEKLRNFEALSELIGSCAKELGELVIMLEDLHWADDLSVQFLEYLGRNLAGRNIFICVTSRKEELREHTVLQKMIHNLKCENRLHQVELRPLTFRSLYSFLDSTITPDSNSSELVKYLKKKTDGNPFFVEEIMRTLLRMGKVSIGEKIETVHFQKIAIPETIEDVVLTRLKDLDRTSQKVVKFAAVLLKPFTYDVMKRLTSLEDTELSEALWELNKRQILVEEDTHYQFYHTTLREAINKRLGDKERSDLNYQIGRTLEKINRGRLNKIVEDLAYYFINAKSHKKGILYGLRAAEKSKKRYANDQAIQFYKGVLGFLGDNRTKHRFNILQELAQIEDRVGYYNDAVKHYNEVLNLKTGTIDQKIKVYLGIANVRESKGEYKRALRIYHKAARFIKKMESSRSKVLLEANINVRIRIAYLQMGNYKRADKFNIDVTHFAKGIKGREARGMLARIYSILGSIEMYRGEYGKTDYAKAIFYYKEAYKYYKKIQTEYGITQIYNNLGVIYFRKLEFQKAFNYYQKATRISRKIGDQGGVSKGFYNLGNILGDEGYYLDALDYFHRAIAISKKIGDVSITGFSYLLLGGCLCKLCSYREAKKYLEKASNIFDEMGWKAYEVYPTWEIGHTYQAQGDYTLALRHYRRALKFFTDRGNQFYIAGLILDIASVYAEIGLFTKAKKNITEALKIARALGLKDAEVEYCIASCRINLISKDFARARDYYKRGIKMAKLLGMKQHVLRLLLLISKIQYRTKKYFKGIDTTNKAIQLAKKLGAKDLYVEALLIKIKNEIGLNTLSKKEITEMMEEALEIAELIHCPKVIWQVYFEHGNIFRNDNEFQKALDYYQKCIEIFMDVSSKIDNKSYEQSYLNRSDRKAVFTAVDNVERLM